MDIFLDRFFFIFHTIFMLFNLLGWVWVKTRLYNLLTLLLTGFSWFVLGIWKGIGYCPCTDWHWQVRHRLGDHDLPNSYVVFLLDEISGLNFDALIVDRVILIAFILSLTISIILNIKVFKAPK